VAIQHIQPDAVNDPNRQFNAEGSQFNGNFENIQRRVYKQLPDEAPVPGTSFGARPARVRKDFVEATPEIVQVDRGNLDAPLKERKHFGNFSAVRAARILHQHRIGFWTTFGAIEHIAVTSLPDPTQDEVDQMYKDFLLFNYLPLPMIPDSIAFANMVVPSKAAAIIRNNLPQMGIVAGGVVPPRLNDLLSNPAEEDTKYFLPDMPPYADSLRGNAFSRQPVLSR
jgi:hypothetical protein